MVRCKFANAIHGSIHVSMYSNLHTVHARWLDLKVLSSTWRCEPSLWCASQMLPATNHSASHLLGLWPKASVLNLPPFRMTRCQHMNSKSARQGDAEPDARFNITARAKNTTTSRGCEAPIVRDETRLLDASLRHDDQPKPESIQPSESSEINRPGIHHQYHFCPPHSPQAANAVPNAPPFRHLALYLVVCQATCSGRGGFREV